MPTDSPRPLPSRPDLHHLKSQAKDLLRSGDVSSLAAALFAIARRYGFASWSTLKSHVESLHAAGRLAAAIDADDVAGVIAMLTGDPSLHGALIGYGQSPALTRVAECRSIDGVSPARLEMAAWMIDHGSDVHEHGEAPLGRAALSGTRIPMMELLVSRGADVNGSDGSGLPVIISPCETVDPDSLQWLLDHGARPNAGDTPYIRMHALDYLIGSYVRTARLARCIDILLAAGAATTCREPSVLALLRGDIDALGTQIDDDPSLIHKRFESLDFGTSGERMLTLRGTTLLHVAAEFDPTRRAAHLLLDAGADVNAAATFDGEGVGGQTPIFHAVAHGPATHEWLPLIRLLIDRGARLDSRATVPGHYESPGEVLDCTPLGYAHRFSGGHQSGVAQALEAAGGSE